VVDALELVPPLPHDLAVAHDESADERMVAGLASSALGKRESAGEVAHASACRRRR
jgi:hypothetical protein